MSYFNFKEKNITNTIILKSRKVFHFLENHKYYYSFLVLIFLFLFFITQSHLHTGYLKGVNYTYRGQIKNQKPQGKGKMVFTNGNFYQGNFEAGEYSGHGKLVNKHKHWIYTGEFTKGLPDGKGHMKLSNEKEESVIFSKGVLIK